MVISGTSKLKDATEKCAQSILDKRITVTDCKRIFLEQMEASFSYYFEDRFTAYTSQVKESYSINMETNIKSWKYFQQRKHTRIDSLNDMMFNGTFFIHNK